jgi:arylsulfatase A-like enzyme
MKTQYLSIAMVALATTSLAAKPKMNVLLLVMDDLRPELNCYGDKSMITPNIDKLAANGVQFNRAYCNVPVSGASRASLMTGIRPGINRFYDVEAKISVDAPGAVTLPKYFKNNGYITYSNSKIIHSPKDAADSWTQTWYAKVAGKTWRNYLGKENLANDGQRNASLAYECEDVSDDQYIDGMTAKKTIEQLRELKASGKPFFIATGILKPHLPFNAPKKYWDLYDFDKIQLPANYQIDRSTYPNQAFHAWNELRFYKNIPADGAIPDDTEARRLIQGYKASVSFADAQVGRIIDELKTLGLDKNTIVVLVGDHGWSLGNHGDWCKHSNFEVVNNMPLIINAPGIKKGLKLNEIAELVDIYPTVCKLAGLPVPEQAEGNSMDVLLKKGKDKKWDNSAVIKWHEGITLMTPENSYTEWIDKNDTIVTQMLFAYKADKAENKNLANESAQKATLTALSQQLRAARGKNFLAPKK